VSFTIESRTPPDAAGRVGHAKGRLDLYSNLFAYPYLAESTRSQVQSVENFPIGTKCLTLSADMTTTQLCQINHLT
jgi:hypothetical protein